MEQGDARRARHPRAARRGRRHAEVGEAADYIPEGMARAAAPDLPEMAQYQVMRHYLRYSQMTLGMDLGSDISEGTCTMKYSAQDARGADPRPQGRRPAPVAGRGHHAGPARDRLRDRPVPEVDQRHGRLHAAARRRLARRVHQRVRHAPLLRGQGRARPAQRDDHDDLLAPVRRRDADGGRLQGHHRHARRERLPGPRGVQRGRQREDRRLHDHQPRGHRHLQPADRQVRRDPARRRRPGVHRPGQRQRHPRLRPGARRRLRRLPLQPAQDVLAARTAARARRPAPTCAPTSWRRTCRCRS